MWLVHVWLDYRLSFVISEYRRSHLAHSSPGLSLAYQALAGLIRGLTWGSRSRNSKAISGIQRSQDRQRWNMCVTDHVRHLGKMLGGAHHCHLLVTLPLALTSHCPTLITMSFCLPQILNRTPPEMSRSWKVMESRHAVLFKSLKRQSAGWAPCAMWDVCLLYGFVIPEITHVGVTSSPNSAIFLLRYVKNPFMTHARILCSCCYLRNLVINKCFVWASVCRDTHSTEDLITGGWKKKENQHLGWAK